MSRYHGRYVYRLHRLKCCIQNLQEAGYWSGSDRNLTKQSLSYGSYGSSYGSSRSILTVFSSNLLRIMLLPLQSIRQSVLAACNLRSLVILSGWPMLVHASSFCMRLCREWCRELYSYTRLPLPLPRSQSFNAEKTQSSDFMSRLTYNATPVLSPHSQPLQSSYSTGTGHIDSLREAIVGLNGTRESLWQDGSGDLVTGNDEEFESICQDLLALSAPASEISGRRKMQILVRMRSSYRCFSLVPVWNFTVI